MVVGRAGGYCSFERRLISWLCEIVAEGLELSVRVVVYV